MSLRLQTLIVISLLSAYPLTSFATDSASSPPPTASEVELVTRLRRSLPAKLRDIIPGQTTKQAVIQSLGKPDSVSKRTGALMYKIGNHEFDTAIGFKGGRVDYLYHEYVRGSSLGSLELESIKNLIPKTALDRAEKELRTSKPTHESGRMLEVAIPSQGLKLDFRNNSKRTLSSIQLSTKHSETFR